MFASAPARISGEPGNLVPLTNQLATLRQAQHAWAAKSVPHRVAVLRKFRHLLAAEADQLCGLVSSHLCRDEADTLSSELLPLAEAVRFTEMTAVKALSSKRVSRKGRPLWLGGVRLTVQRDPWGIVLVIGPSNYPIFLPGVQVIQALAAGNAVIWKPGSGGARVALELAELLTRAGLPEGLLLVTNETAATGIEWIRTGVNKIVMTGSVVAGQHVLTAAAEHVTPATVELSGCDAMFVLASADISRAVDALLFGLQLNGSATCIAPRRVFLDARIESAFKHQLALKLPDMKPAVISNHQLSFIRDLVRDAVEKGASLISLHRQLENPLRPVVLQNAVPSMEAMRSDIFAPMVSLCTFNDEADALSKASECPYALGATVFGQASLATSFAQRVPGGIVVVNDMIVPTADPRISFGGRGASGFGKTRGVEGLLEMTVSKTIAVQTARRLRHLEPPHARASNLFSGFLKCVHGSGMRYRLSSALKLAGALQNKTGSKV